LLRGKAECDSGQLPAAEQQRGERAGLGQGESPVSVQLRWLACLLRTRSLQRFWKGVCALL